MLRLLVGLGNPGTEYEHTRHNAGFWFVDEVAHLLKVALLPDRSHFGLSARANTPNGPLWLLQPMTYMNLSGKSVAALARFYKIAPAEILVAHDELDLLPGQLKLKRAGSHAGHNGLKDIQAQLGSADFWRLRLGIGHPGVKAEVANHVLRKPPLAEREAIDDAIRQAMTAWDLLQAGEMDKAVVKLHGKPQRPNKPPPVKPAPAASPQATGAPAPAASPLADPPRDPPRDPSRDPPT